jgi:hypothetical protein
MASEYPFRGIIGVELIAELHRAAQENLAAYKSKSQRCFALEAICGDATDFRFPDDPLVLYLFDPLPESGLRRVLDNLRQSLRAHPRAVYVLYQNPVLERVLEGSSVFVRVGGSEQYSIYFAGGAVYS